MFDVNAWNRERYDRDQADLQRLLDEMSGTLADRIIALHEQQLDCGFIRDRLTSVRRTNLVRPESTTSGGPSGFIVQYNPKRALRFSGSGRREPPIGTPSAHSGCFLCRENIYWQQFGLEMGYHFSVNDRGYYAWCNPFPFMNRHVTIASDQHEPQSWIGADEGGNSKRFERLMEDLFAIAGQLPGFVVFYNGDGAGASISGHRHYHAFQRSPGQSPFPIERSAEQQMHSGQPPFHILEYPITSLFFQDRAEAICHKSTQFVDEWTRFRHSSALMSANIIAYQHKEKEGSDSDCFRAFFVPRNTYLSTSSGRSETIAGLEVLGEIAFSQEAEFDRLIAGEIDYNYVWRMLRSVEAAEANALIKERGAHLF